MSTDNSFDAAAGVLKRKPDDDLNEPETKKFSQTPDMPEATPLPTTSTVGNAETVVPFDNRRKDMRYARSRIEWNLVNLLNVKKVFKENCNVPSSSFRVLTVP
jgi:hypothetical protein